MIKETFEAWVQRTLKLIPETHEKIIGIDRVFQAFLFGFFSVIGRKEREHDKGNKYDSQRLLKHPWIICCLVNLKKPRQMYGSKKYYWSWKNIGTDLQRPGPEAAWMYCLNCSWIRWEQLSTAKNPDQVLKWHFAEEKWSKNAKKPSAKP